MKYIINSFIVCLADLISKQYINKRYKVSERAEKYPGMVYIWNTKNKGIAYNKLETMPGVVKLVTGTITAVLGAVFADVMIRQGASNAFKFGISAAFGGALGNFIDRMKNGCVTDFIYIKSKRIKNMPIFNLADVAIFFGCILMLISDFFKK